MFASATDLIPALASVDLTTVDAGELDIPQLTSLVRQLAVAEAKLDALGVKLLGEFERREAWRGTGARGTAGWMAGHTTMSGAEARGKLAVAEQLEAMPVTGSAFDEGRIDLAQVRQLGKAATDAGTADQFAHDEQALLDEVRSRPADDAGKAVDRWRNRQAPEAAADRARRQHARRSFRSWIDRDGMGMIQASVTPEVLARTRNTMQELLDADWTNRHQGDDLPTDQRNAAQRSADAFEQLVARAHATLTSGEGQAPPAQLLVDVSYDDLIAATGGGTEVRTQTPLTGEAVRRLACDAGISRQITKGRSLILDKGRTTRLATPTQREAVLSRDGGCIFPTCEAPPAWCRIHHSVFWEEGGLTDIGNLAAVCDHHHHHVHDLGWDLRPDDTGRYWWTSPSGRRYAARQRALSPPIHGPSVAA